MVKAPADARQPHSPRGHQDVGPARSACGVAGVDFPAGTGAVRGAGCKGLMAFIPAGFALDSQNLAGWDPVSQVFGEQRDFFLTLGVILVLMVTAVRPGAEQPTSP